MSKEQLAIASVPVQDYGEIYDDKKALCEGTIFSELDMPFFAADGENGKSSGKSALFGMNQKLPEEKEREELMTKLTEVSFVLDDLTLYLDTHGDEEQAVSLYEQKLTERETLKKQFAEKFYPLTRDCIPYCAKKEDGRFCWQTGPMPWEGACV